MAHRNQWTVLVFMNAANDLDPFSLTNMNQMERLPANSDVKIVVQWKQSLEVNSFATFDGTRRYLIRHDSTSAINSRLLQDMGKGVDMGSPQTLTDFISYGMRNFPADHYCLVMWNHGNGWKRRGGEDDEITRGISYDGETGHHIDTWQLADALGTQPIDILAWDASLMQQVEVGTELTGKVKYMVGSEDSPPGAGYPYDFIFSEMATNPLITAREAADQIVTQTVDYYSNQPQLRISQSVVDVDQLTVLDAKLDQLADALIDNVNDLQSIIPQVRDTAQAYKEDAGLNRHFRDVGDVCVNLESLTSIPEVLSASQDVRTALSSAVLTEGHNAQSSGSHGLSIDFSSGAQFTAGSPPDRPIDLYANLRFAVATHWDEWLTIAP